MNAAIKAKFDETRWPVVIVTPPAQALEGNDFAIYLDEVDAYYQRERSFGYVFDIRRAPPLSAARRSVVAERIDRSRTAHPQVRGVMSVVLASAIQRGLARAISWLTPQPIPTNVASSIDEGVRWVMHELAGASGRAGALTPGP